MSLTNATCRSATPRPKPYKLFDDRGLYLLINPTGSKLWGWKYRFARREKSLRFGPYPEVSLKMARDRRDKARQLLRQGSDPAELRKQAKMLVTATDPFKQTAQDFIAQIKGLSPVTVAKKRWLLEQIKPLHNESIATLDTPTVFAAIQHIEASSRIETAHRAAMFVGEVLRYAIVTGRRTERDVTPDLRGHLEPVSTVSHAGLTDPQAVGGLMRAIQTYDGHLVVRAALKVAPYVFVRPLELRGAEWSEFDFDKAEWLIPAHRMKMKRPHLVPLATQVVALLEELRLDTGDQPFVFPGPRLGRCMSENAITAALRSMFYESDEQTWHGFRTTASTLLNELGYDPAIVELQLAHAKKNKVAAVYDRSQRLAERTKMMQRWADYLDELRSGEQRRVA